MRTPEHQIVPSFESVTELDRALQGKGCFGAGSLYPRDGSELLDEIETKTAEFTHVSPHENVLFGSGMAAVSAALEVALDEVAKKEQPIVASAYELYGKTADYLRWYARQGRFKLVQFDSGDVTSVDAMCEEKAPDIILAETVGNGPSVPVLNMRKLLFYTSMQRNKPTIILDNTLPLSTAHPIGKELLSDEAIMVVESGTKSYTANQETSGLVYTRNEGLLEKIRAFRCMAPSPPGIASLERMAALLPKTQEAFDERNKRLYKNTGKLALSLYQAEQDGADFTVSHPGVPNHPNYNYAKRYYPEGCSPVLFLQCAGMAGEGELAERLYNNETVREYADLGQSFGFDRTRILPNKGTYTVRIAGGAETNADALGRALYDAALSSK